MLSWVKYPKMSMPWAQTVLELNWLHSMTYIIEIEQTSGTSNYLQLLFCHQVVGPVEKVSELMGSQGGAIEYLLKKVRRSDIMPPTSRTHSASSFAEASSWDEVSDIMTAN